MSLVKSPAADTAGSLTVRLCNTHKSNKRRHGHAQQRGVTAAVLEPHREAVQAVIERNREESSMDTTGDALEPSGESMRGGCAADGSLRAPVPRLRA